MISTNNNYNKTNFGMAVKATPQAMEVLESRLTKRGAKKLNKIVEAQKNNPTDIHLNRFKGTVYADVAGKRFNPMHILEELEDSSWSIVKMVKKAAKHADNHTAKQNIIKNFNIEA